MKINIVTENKFILNNNKKKVDKERGMHKEDFFVE